MTHWSSCSALPALLFPAHCATYLHTHHPHVGTCFYLCVFPQDRDRRTMLFEERLEAAERRRMDGNALFAEGKYTEALAKYALVRDTAVRQG